MSSPPRLPIKHPTLRPRIYDPFSRGADASHRPSLGDAPGAIAVRGPEASRRDDLLATDDVSSFYREDFENDTGGSDDDGAVDTVDDQEIGEIVGEEQQYDDEVDSDRHARALSSDTTKKHSRFCLAGSVMVALGLFAIISFVVIKRDNDEGKPNTQSPVSSPPGSLPSATAIDDDEGDADWTLVAEIAGSVDSFGFKVDLNSNATLVAVSAPMAYNGRGQVEVFRRITPLPTAEGFAEWDRVGTPIIGDSNGDLASLGMDLSLDGSHLAIGYPGNGNGFVRVFRLDNDEWKQQGQTLAGPSLMSDFGISVALNKNGTYLVVGAPLAGEQDQGMISAYKWMPEALNWTDYGNVRYGGNYGDRFGSSVGMNSNGDIVTVGAPFDDTRWEDGGRIYDLELRSASSSTDCSSSGCWDDIALHRQANTGDFAGARFGQTHALRPDGLGLVSSSISYNNEQISKSEYELNRPEVGVGKVRVILEDTGTRTPFSEDVGLGIFGSVEGEGLGFDVAVSDGYKMVLAATTVNKKNQTGIARVYQPSVGFFAQLGSDIKGLAMGSGVWHGTGPLHSAGPSVSIMSQSLAVGYQSVLLREEEKEVPGAVRIFKLQPV